MADRESEIEETNAGIRKKGNWKEVSEFGEEVKEVMEETTDKESLKDFEEWRPKTEEAENDMKKKTVDKAVLGENKLEQESEGIKEDFKEASEKIAEAGKKARKKQAPANEVTEASEDVARPFYKNLAKIFRRIEKLVYEKISLRANPYYFDSENFSASFKPGKKGYQMEINVNDKRARENMKQRLKE